MSPFVAGVLPSCPQLIWIPLPACQIIRGVFHPLPFWLILLVSRVAGRTRGLEGFLMRRFHNLNLFWGLGEAHLLSSLQRSHSKSTTVPQAHSLSTQEAEVGNHLEFTLCIKFLDKLGYRPCLNTNKQQQKLKQRPKQEGPLCKVRWESRETLTLNVLINQGSEHALIGRTERAEVQSDLSLLSDDLLLPM